MKIICCLISNMQIYCKGQHKSNKNKKSHEQLTQFQDLAKRILGDNLAQNITFILDDKNNNHHKNNQDENNNEYFILNSQESNLKITSNSKSGLSRGLYYYMKEYMNSSISWNGDNIQKLDYLPSFNDEIKIQTTFGLRYLLNYCTYSYSMSFWDWQRWEREIDWMALQGINMPLAILGTSKIWQNTLQKFNYTINEILDFIPGPAFEAWWLMGNLEGYGGPVSQDHIDGQVELQKKILNRMREFGMQPVLQGFYGMVPNSLKQKYPNSQIYGDQTWLGFTRPSFLDADDELFSQMAKVYYEESEKLFGRAKYYGGDPFHEGAVVPGLNLTSQAISIYKEMSYNNKNKNDKTIWILQSWQNNPSKELLQGLQNDECIILDMMAEARSKWQTDDFSNHNFIWASLPNFGMRIGQYGMIEQYLTQPKLAQSQKQSTLKGIGSLPEGILTNVLDYELLFDIAWKDYNIPSLTPRQSIQKYLKDDFIRFRYGKSNNKNLFTAWSLLTQSVYNSDNSWDGPSESLMLSRPNATIDRVSSWGTTGIYWNTTNVLEAWRYFNDHVKEVTQKHRRDKIQQQEELQEKTNNSSDNNNEGIFIEIQPNEERNLFQDTFLYDLIDTARQNLASYSYLLFNKVIAAFNQTDTVKFAMYSQQFLELIKDQDELLSSRKEFMIGHYLQQAYNLGTTEEEKENFVEQLKRQYTVWSDFDSPLHDYANKEWSGILNDFYLPRWELYFKSLQEYVVQENEKELKLKLEQQKKEEEDYSSEDDEDDLFMFEQPKPIEEQIETVELIKEEVLSGQNIDWYSIEIQFSQNKKQYPIEPQISELQINKRLFQKYYSIILLEHVNINQIKPVVQKQYQIRLQPKPHQSYSKIQKNNKQDTLQQE